MSDENALLNPIVNNNFFELEKEASFFSMLSLMLPELVDPEFDAPDNFVTCYAYQTSTYNLENDLCYAFAVSNGELIRILSAKIRELKMHEDGEKYYWENIVNPKIKEAILKHEEVKKIVAGVINYYHSI